MTIYVLDGRVLLLSQAKLFSRTSRSFFVRHFFFGRHTVEVRPFQDLGILRALSRLRHPQAHQREVAPCACSYIE